MLKKQIPRLLAILVIVVVGFLYMNQMIERTIALWLCVGAFMITQGFSCYQMKQRKENWRREFIMSVTYVLIMLVLLVL